MIHVLVEVGKNTKIVVAEDDTQELFLSFSSLIWRFYGKL
jgi:hypothetical protein